MGMDAPEGSFTEGHALLADDIFLKLRRGLLFEDLCGK